MQDGEGEYIPLTSILEPYKKELYLDDGEPNTRVWEEILEEQIGEIELMDLSRVMSYVNEEILTPIQENIEGIVTEVLEQYEVEQKQLMAYNEAIMEYNPLEYIDKDKMQALTDDMMDNGVALSEAVLDTDTQQMEYVMDVYAATREDIFALQDSIIEAKEDSDKAVEEGLADLKEIKNINSAENQQVLYDFSLKLPYTRLGSLEYRQAYEFMVNPLALERINGMGNTGSFNTQRDSVKQESDSVNVRINKQEDYHNVLLLITGMICAIIVGNTIKYHYHRKEKTLEG